MQFVWAVLGGFLLLFVTLDIIWTTLWVDGGAGPLTNFMTSLFWKGLKRVGPQDKVLEQAGPIILGVILLTWVLLVWIGWFLLLLFIDDPLINTIDGRSLNRLDLFYFAGTIIFTFGNGDYAPSPGVMQVLTTLMSGYGMIILSLGISYILSVLEGVVHKRRLAKDISSIGSSTEEFLMTIYEGSEFYDVTSTLDSLSSDLNQTAIQQQAYPLLSYYHSGDTARSLSYVLPVLADSLFVVKYGLRDNEGIDEPFIKKTLAAIDHYLESNPADFHSQEEDISPELPDYDYLEKQNFPLLPKQEFTEKFNKLDSLRKDLYAGRYENFPGGEG